MQQAGGEIPLMVLYLREDYIMKFVKEIFLQVKEPSLNEVIRLNSC